MKTKKKTFCMRTTMLLLLMLLTTVSAWADDSGSCGTNVTYSYVESTHTLTISGTGAMADYKKYQTPWDKYYPSLTSVVIEDGVTSIGECAFYELVKVTTISLGSDVTTIGKSAFQLCKGLTSVTIPNNVTNIDEHAFDGCEKLETLSFGNGVTRIGSWAFQGCIKLTTISFGSGLTKILEGAFQGCTSLSSVNLPASLKSIGSDAFKNCNSQATVTLNSNPNIAGGKSPAFDNNTTIKMNLTANAAGSDYWMTFYNKNYSFSADANTTIYKGKVNGNSVQLTEVDDIPADNAAILKSTASPIVLTLTTTASGDFTDNDLKGAKADTDASGMSYAYCLSNGLNGVGFYKYTGNTTGSEIIPANRAYLIIPGSSSAPGRGFYGFDETTKIESLTPALSKGEGAWYDLQGRKVAEPTKGMYIVNGKKVFIK